MLVLPGEFEHVEEFGQNRASRWAQNVVLAIEEQNDWSSDEQDSWQEECEPKANKFLDVSVKGRVSVNAAFWKVAAEIWASRSGFISGACTLSYLHHGDLTSQRADVDSKIKVRVQVS